MNLLTKFFKRTKEITTTTAAEFKALFGDWFKLNGDTQLAGWVFVAVDTWGKYFAKARFRVYNEDRGGIRELENHLYSKLFVRPNDFQTWWEVKYRIALDFSFNGNSYLYKIRNDARQVIGFQQLNPYLVDVKQANGVMIHHYEYYNSSPPIPIAKDDIIHFRYPSPTSQIKGRAIIENIADQVDVDAMQRSYVKMFYDSGGFLGLTFTTDKDMTDSAFKRLKAELQNEYGGSKKAYRVGLFDNGLKPVPAPHSIRSMDINNARKITKEEILSTWSVPPILAGIGEGINRNTADASIYQFTSGTIDPILDYIDEVFSIDAKLEFGNKFLIKHDKLAPKDVEGQIKYYESGLKNGWLNINEVRKEENYNKVQGDLADTNTVNVGGSLVRVDTGKQIAVEGTAPTPPKSFKPEPKPEPTKIHHLPYVKDGRIIFGQVQRRYAFLTRAFATNFQTYLDSQQRRILEAVKDNFIVGEAFNLTEENVELHQLLEIDLWDIMTAGYNYSASLYGVTDPLDRPGLQLTFDKIANSVLIFNTTTQNELTKIADASVDVLPEKLASIYQAASTRMTGTVTGTTTSAFSAASLYAMKLGGLTTKTWLSMRDPKVRNTVDAENHLEPDGVTIQIDDYFQLRSRSGYDFMQHPADPAGSPENIINCRCVLIGE